MQEIYHQTIKIVISKYISFLILFYIFNVIEAYRINIHLVKKAISILQWLKVLFQIDIL
jgi:hypothetical protein